MIASRVSSDRRLGICQDTFHLGGTWEEPEMRIVITGFNDSGKEVVRENGDEEEVDLEIMNERRVDHWYGMAER